MKNNIKFLTVLALLFLGEAKAQIGFGTNSPDNSAVLEIKANGSAVGLLLPRLTTAQRDASIKSPSAGLVIYNSSTNALEVAVSGSLWLNVINGTTTAATSGVSSSTGNVGIGTTSPDANAALDVKSTTKGFLLPQSSTDPNGVEGMIYYNSASDTVKLYNGSSWIALIN
jgi:hypothetical protein